MVDFISVLLGVLAVALPLRAISPKRIDRKGYHYLIFSLAYCAMAIQLQLFVVLTLMWSGQTDGLSQTFEQLIPRSIFLVIATLLANAWALHCKKVWKHKMEVKELEEKNALLLEAQQKKVSKKLKKQPKKKK